MPPDPKPFTDPPPLPAAAELARRVRDRDETAREVTERAIRRIEACDGAVAAFCTLAADQAMDAAADIDRRRAAGEDVGPLAGVPVAVKDLIPTRGIRTTFGSALYRDYVPTEDDVSVERLRAAGAVVIGKTNTSEFGYGPVSHNALFAPTRNPWNTGLTPGGSSAGSAAAVAAGMVPVAIGSDGGGSIRVPAALCGVIGFKPSWGRVAIYPSCRDERLPGASGWESLEHIGPIAATVADAALVMSVIAGPDARDRHSLPAGDVDWSAVRPELARSALFAYSPDLGFARVDCEVEAIARVAARTFEAAGGIVEEAGLRLPDPQDAFEAIVALETDRAGLRRLARERGVSYGPSLSAVLARNWTAAEFGEAILVRKRVTRLLAEHLARWRFLLTPATATAAFPLGADAPAAICGMPVPPSAWTPFSSIANLAGLPSATVPAGFTREGLPVGLQITGRHLDDIGVLSAAALFEVSHPVMRPALPVAGTLSSGVGA